MQRRTALFFRVVIFFAPAFLFLLAVFALPAFAQRAAAPRDLNYQVFLPLVTHSACDNIAGETYDTLVPNPPPTDRPAAQHADLNLALRGYAPTTDFLGLVDLDGPTDRRSPKLYTLFADQRVPVFANVSQVYGWDWATNSRGALITEPPVTLAGMQVTANEPLYVPSSGYNIGT
jgi:hypothetical protein